MILHETSRIRRWAVIAVQLPPQHAENRHLLAAMVRGMRNPANHHPRPRSLHIEEFRFGLPPAIIFRLQFRKPFPAVLRVALHEFQARLQRWQRRRTNVNPQHVDKPQIFAHALMHHLFVNAAPSRVSLSRTHRQVLVAEFTPHAHNFYPLGPVRFHQEFISHDGHPAKRQRKFSPPAIDASTLTLARISVASPLVNNCLLTWTWYRSIYIFTRALLLLPPVFGART